MEQCQNCKHERKAHLPDGAIAAVRSISRQMPPIEFNSITAGEEIVQQIEMLRKQRLAKEKLSE